MKAPILLAIAIQTAFAPFFVNAQNNADSGTASKTIKQPNRVHNVLRGETLYKIAKQYGCTIDEIKKLNKNTEPLLIGARLIIPPAKTASTATTATATTAANKPANPEKPAPTIVKETETFKSHTVVSGETLSKIAIKYGTTVAELKTTNKLTGDGLRIGQKLLIPNVPAAKPLVAKQQDTLKTTPAAKVEKEPAKTTAAEPQAKGTVKTNPVQPKDVNPGMPEKASAQSQIITENIVEKEEVGKARILKGKMDDTRTYAMHPSIPKGNIVVVIHPSTGRMAYCKIIDNYAPSQYSGSGILITPAVAQKIGVSGSIADVKIKYAAP
jgi:LysM repeat protein